MRASRLSVSSTGESSRLPIKAPASAIVRKSGTMPSYPRGREDVGGFRAHRALTPHPFRHLLNEMGRRGDFRLFALRNLEPGTGERRLDLRAGHALRFHDAVSPMLRLPHSGGIRPAAEQNIWQQMRIAQRTRGGEGRIRSGSTNRWDA